MTTEKKPRLWTITDRHSAKAALKYIRHLPAEQRMEGLPPDPLPQEVLDTAREKALEYGLPEFYVSWSLRFYHERTAQYGEEYNAST